MSTNAHTDPKEKEATPHREILALKSLSFLDKNMKHFHPVLRNLIGFSVLLVFIMVSLHAFIAPSYIRGSLYMKESESKPWKAADGYFIHSGDYTSSVDKLGSWVLPVSGFWPSSVRIAVQDPFSSRNTMLAEFKFWQWPLGNAISHFDPVVKIYLYRNDHQIEITDSGDRGTSYFRQVSAESNRDFPGLPAEALRIQVHLEGIGDIECSGTGWCGTIGQKRRLEGFTIFPAAIKGDVRIVYMGYVEGIGDLSWQGQGAYCGTRGQGKRLEGFAIRLEGSDAPSYSIAYQAHMQSTGNTEIFRDGAFAGTRNQAQQIEAIRVWLERKK